MSDKTVKVPYGYQLVHFQDCIIAIPICEPAYEPKILNPRTNRWNKLSCKHSKKRAEQAFTFLEEAKVYYGNQRRKP